MNRRSGLISAVASPVIVGVPFAIETFFPRIALAVVALPLVPGMYVTDFVFRVVGLSPFDQSGDLRSSFAVGMVAVSIASWCVSVYVVSALLSRISAAMQAKRTAG